MNGWEFAGYVLWFAAVLGAIGFFARESWRAGRNHRAANERIGDEHQPVLVQAQAWQQSTGAGTTAFPASHPPKPSRLGAGWLWLGQAWSTLVVQLRGGDRFAAPGGKHTPTLRWTTGDVARHLAARSHLSDDEVRDIVRQEFDAGLAAEQPTGLGAMPDRLPWDVLDRAQGSAPVERPFDEQIRAQNEVLHWLARDGANGEPTTLLPTVPPGGAR
ncbi:hypothetical protein ACGFIW_02035 [Micromonospora sp. NPDC048935]|uniref:hypothetical protein n=1 Tax=Micromonospora sp. NPDC048935 TaxID=3364262 RepID=UPI003723EF25